ncbi:MAG: hypothetical protein R3C14_13025 [Caldilineaceae bacterium]
MSLAKFSLRQFVKADWRLGWLVATLLLYSALAGYQLGLPGLHYDEAREAGLNAMELLTGAPLSAFGGSALALGGRSLPLMVQNYIGALNVYLALPLLWLTGIGVPNLRALAIVTGLVALLLLERAVSEWWRWHTEAHPNWSRHTPLSTAGLIALTLLAASPTFVFWSRQGIFVTNLTQPFTFWSLWQGVRWLRTGNGRALWWSALAGGCALYAKLLALWVIAPFTVALLGTWAWRRHRGQPAARLSPLLLVSVVSAFFLPLLPLLLFNLQTAGTVGVLTSNLKTSYYGVNNQAVWANLLIRSRQLGQVLMGNHLWYLGGLYANPLAPWLAGVLLLTGLARGWRLVAPPLLLLLAAFVCSLVTISDLFITHYALLQPLLIGVIALALAAMMKTLGPAKVGRLAAVAVVLLWLGFDLSATVRYHAALTRTGGLADHSDASYHLAYYLRYHGLGAPLALDWGFDATVRYLSVGTVTPIELFGYDSPTAPDPEFAQRLRLFLTNPDNVYLLHTPSATAFQGRRERFLQEVTSLGLKAQLETQFSQRDGTPLIELWRAAPP